MNDLMKILLDVDKLSEKTYQDKDKITENANDYNRILKTKNRDFLLTSEDDAGNLLPPVIMAGFPTSEEHDVIYMGLNPLFSKDTFKEKIACGDSWDNYFDSYIDGTVYEHLFAGQTNKYYQKVIKVLFGLFNNEIYDDISIPVIRKSKEYVGLTDGEILLKLVNGRSVIFPELIPFHSKNFDITYKKINDLRENSTSYHNYYAKILSYIKSSLKSDGLIIGNGSSTARVLSEVLIGEGGKIVYDDDTISIIRIESKHALCVKVQFFCGAGNTASGINVSKIVNKVKEVIDNRNQEQFDQIEYVLKDTVESEPESKSKSKEVEDKKKVEPVITTPVRDKSEVANQTVKISKVVNEVVNDVIANYSSIDLNKSNNQYFYIDVPNNLVTDHIATNSCRLCYEKIYTKNRLTMKVMSFDVFNENSKAFIQAAKSYGDPFKVSDKPSKTGASKQLMKKNLFDVDTSKSIEVITAEIKESLTNYFDQNHHIVLKAFS